jgi:protein-S-isoprenylcysteine O-methyltransferase Ste14
MEAWMWIVIAVAAVVVIALVAWAMMTRRRTEDLRHQFGPEYDAT